MSINDTSIEQKLEEIRKEGALQIADMNRMVEVGLNEIEELKTDTRAIVTKAKAINETNDIKNKTIKIKKVKYNKIFNHKLSVEIISNENNKYQTKLIPVKNKVTSEIIPIHKSGEILEFDTPTEIISFIDYLKTKNRITKVTSDVMLYDF